MEIYTLDPLFRREKVVDKFESLIWTERWQGIGEFELILPQSFQTRDYFKANTWLALNETYRCMGVETLEDYIDDEGRQLTKVTGRSIEKVLDDRVAFNVKSDLTAHPTWDITLAPMAAALKVFNDICRDGTVDTHDVIPYLAATSIFPADTLAVVTDLITFNLEPQSVREAVQGIAELYDFGYRLVRNLDTSQLVFNVYAGSDRTSGQVVYPPVIFSAELDNFSQPHQLDSVNGSKNIAYVYSPVGFTQVVPDDVDPNTEGFERQILVVKADDITDPTPAVATALMRQRGLQELSKYRNFGLFDGEVTQYSQYKYDRDYYLGDLIETRNSSGFANYMRVSEQIFVSDSEGDRSYPTLETKKFVTPGSWSSWPLVSWVDYAADLFAWADAP